MGGRKPLPTQVKQIKGTLQPCRTNYHEPIPEGLLVEPPDYMPEGAKAAWRYALDLLVMFRSLHPHASISSHADAPACGGDFDGTAPGL